MPENTILAYQKAISLFKKGQEKEAEELLRQIVEENPDHREALFTLGVHRLRLEDYEEAEKLLRKALQLGGEIHPEIYVNIAEASRYLGKYTQAEEYLARAWELDAGNYRISLSEALLYLQSGQYNKALMAYKKCFQARRGIALNDHAVPGYEIIQAPMQKPETSVYKLRHDIEQIDYLIENGKIPASYKRIADTYTSLAHHIPERSGSSTYVMLDPASYETIESSYNRALYIAEAPRLQGPAINTKLDAATIEKAYLEGEPSVVFFDDFLTPEALASLRAFCLESTIWNNFQYGTYLGAFMDDGFYCELLVQIAEELRERFPIIFKNHRLHTMWAFKYDSYMEGVPLHADHASVNVNFWITPSEANLNKEEGGLVVYKAETPKDWDFRKFNGDQAAIKSFLKESDAVGENIPHRQNRAVMFNSKLFHKSGDVHFKSGYENRRINITMLYKRFPLGE